MVLSIFEGQVTLWEILWLQHRLPEIFKFDFCQKALCASRKLSLSNRTHSAGPAEGIKYLLDESDINDDLRRIFRHSSKGGGSVSSVSSVRKSQASANDDGPGGLPGLTPSGDEHSIYIDDGRLYYDHKWWVGVVSYRKLANLASRIIKALKISWIELIMCV